MNGAASRTPIRPGMSVNQLASTLSAWNRDWKSPILCAQVGPALRARQELSPSWW